MAISPDDPIIQELKQQYSDIFGIEIAGVDYVYRGLTVAEIKHAAQFSSETDQEDYYVRTALLCPADVDVDRMLAGHFVKHAQAIISSSGLFDIDTVQRYLDTARLQLESDVLSVMKCYIIAAMPSYKDVELD